jgi:2OG-Fe(II) oxygenase superfamily
MADPSSNGVYSRPNFLPLPALLKMLDGLDRLSAHWAPSQSLGLLGRGHTSQIRATDIAVQAQLDEIGRYIAPAALQWARTCGFWFSDLAPSQLFPVKMVGDAQTPAYQDPHVDSYAGQSNPPICTNVFYARTHAIEGGGLAIAKAESDLEEPIVVQPSANTMVTFAGDRVHWVQPLFAGERISVVIDFY